MLKHTLARCIASRVESAQFATKQGNEENHARFWLEIAQLETDFLPSGNGFDNGTSLDREKSTPTKLIFHTSFHHMDEFGGYAGWTDHTVTVLPTFDGFDIRVSGRNRNEIKDYIADVFHECLSQTITSEWDADSQRMTFRRAEDVPVEPMHAV